MRAWFLKIAFLASVFIFSGLPAPAAQRAPDLDLQDMKGGHHKLADYKGKVVLLNFWATYCVPCATEMPMLAEMQRRYKDKLVVIAASIDDPLDKDKLQPFLLKHKAGNLTLMVGPTLDTLFDLGLGEGLPATLFIDAEGNVAAKTEGALKRPDLEKRLAQMTGSAKKAAIKKTPVKTNKK
jgi:thiol-disulfide isomerase/thioredoxin